jgi:GNAT superfamily N-acetyltransferase
MKAQLERLRPGEGERWRRIRLSALTEAPHAFGTTYAQAAQWDPARWEAQVVELATFVALIDGRDVGVARGAPHQTPGARELISMWVAPSARRQGIGAQLIESVVAWAEADGASELVLDVVATNASAIALYQRSRFVRLDAEPMSELAASEIRLVRRLAKRSG